MRSGVCLLIAGAVVMLRLVPRGGQIQAPSFITDKGEMHVCGALVSAVFRCFSALCREELTETWVNGQKICVSANDLRTRWHELDGAVPANGKHFPARNGSYGVDVLLLDESEVNALTEAGHKELPRLASSEGGMTALYDMGESPAGRYLMASRGQVFSRTNSFQKASREYIRRASEVRNEEVLKFLAAFDAAMEAGLDHYQASDVARGFITLENALNPESANPETASGDDAGLYEIPF